MPVKGLIKQFYRPIDTAVISKAPHSTPSQSVTSPIVKNQFNGNIDNDIIDKPIISISKSLLATSMAGINTTPCVLTIGNSSLDPKFESLESKLCGKIIAMKSYFIDGLRSLKNETTINKEQNCNINTEKTTTLKNKTKLLELENKLLKDGVTNKKKVIDTTLTHNSKLSQNFVLVALTLLHTRQESNRLKGNITRKKMLS